MGRATELTGPAARSGAGVPPRSGGASCLRSRPRAQSRHQHRGLGVGAGDLGPQIGEQAIGSPGA
ncbi:hypothetical protein AB0C93_37710, partial [Streptomyces sp. NPDC048518]|uniref:hypothetical protein n=1 Tax=Streptomyces sp. NPDC048518 TaxID=3155029 RepID=UPI0034019608